MNKSLVLLLLCLKNGAVYKKSKFECYYNSKYLPVINLLYKLGYIQTFCIKTKTLKNRKTQYFVIHLRHMYGNYLLNNVKLVSSPANERTVSYTQLSINAYGIQSTLFINTNKGLKTHLECKKEKLGGTLLFSC